MNVGFHTGPLNADAWLRILAVAFGESMMVALEKWLRARVEPHQASAIPWQPLAHRS